MQGRVTLMVRSFTTCALLACFGSVFAQEPIVEAIYGAGNQAGSGIPATLARGAGALHIAFALDGTIYLSDEYGRIRKISTEGVVWTIAGSDNLEMPSCGFSGDGGAAASAQFCYPLGIALDATGNIYVADNGNRRIRKISASGSITTIAGTTFGFSGDGGPATSARLASATGLVFDAQGNLYFSDTANDRIRKITPTGIISTVVGSGVRGFSGDGGPATSAALNLPRGLAFDAAENLYIADVNNHRVRRVTKAGVISTIAGSGPLEGAFAGDGSRAVDARLNQPIDVVTDRVGNLYVSDFGNKRIRRISTSGVIATVAGNGLQGDVIEGVPATTTPLNPMGLRIDNQDRLVAHHWGQVFQWKGLNPLVRIPISVSLTESPAEAMTRAVEEGVVNALDTGSISSAVANLLLDSLTPIQTKLAWIAANPSSPDLARMRNETCSLINQFNTQMDHYVRLRRLSASLRDGWKADMQEVKVELGCGN